MVKGMCFVSGVIFGVLLTCAACMNGPVFGQGPGPNGPGAYGPGPGAYGPGPGAGAYGPGPGPGSEGPGPGAGYYGPPPSPPPGSHPEISKAMNELQQTKYVLMNQAANDYQGHKANAIGYINNAISELQICQSMP